MSQHDAIIEVVCRLAGVSMPDAELRFAKPRRWRFDYAWAVALVAIEVEGGAWVGGRHTRGKGFENDCKKYNEAAARGWRVLRWTPGMLARDPAGAADTLRRAIYGEAV